MLSDKEKQMVTMIDPPNGDCYGFPKIFPDNTGNIPAWLVENGYPQSEVDKWDGDVPYKMWQWEVVVQ